MKPIRVYLLILFLFSILIIPAMASQNLATKKIAENSPWYIGGDYYIIVEGLDNEGQQAFISIKKSGEILKDSIIEPGDKFEYYDASETRIVSMKLESIFKGSSTGNCQFTNIYLRFGESSSTPTPTITSSRTESAQTDPVDNIDNDTSLFGLSTPMILIILISAILLIGRKKE
jgi:hypothetical protein